MPALLWGCHWYCRTSTTVVNTATFTLASLVLSAFLQNADMTKSRKSAPSRYATDSHILDRSTCVPREKLKTSQRYRFIPTWFTVMTPGLLSNFHHITCRLCRSRRIDASTVHTALSAILHDVEGCAIHTRAYQVVDITVCGSKISPF